MTLPEPIALAALFAFTAYVAWAITRPVPPSGGDDLWM